MADESIAFGAVFRRPDGAYFEVKEIYHDGCVGGDLLFAGSELFPRDWLELAPDDLSQMKKISEDEWRAKIQACAASHELACSDLC